MWTTRWKTRKNSFVDAQGNRHRVMPLKTVLKKSGLKRADLVRKEDLKSFWAMFILFGSVFSIVIQLVNTGITFATARYLTSPADFPLVDENWILIGLFNFISYGGVMGFVFSRTTWRTPEHAKDAILRAGLCPACMYTIEGIPADEHGCTLCPECGVSWCCPARDKACEQ